MAAFRAEKGCFPSALGQAFKISYFFLSGWEAGREWALLSLDARGEETIGYSYSSEQLLCELGGNSMPSPTIQQSTKRGPLTPLPSQG
jgi:hypothetical protein